VKYSLQLGFAMKPSHMPEESYQD